MRLQNDRNAIRIEIDSLFGRAEIYEEEKKKRMVEGHGEIAKEVGSDKVITLDGRRKNERISHKKETKRI